MSENDKHKNALKALLDYLSAKITGKERNAFEREMEKDPFLSDAIEGLSELGESELNDDLIELQKRLDNRLYRRRSITFIRIAAAVAILLVVSSLFFWIVNRNIDDVPGNLQVTESLKKGSDKQEEKGKTFEEADDPKTSKRNISSSEAEKGSAPSPEPENIDDDSFGSSDVLEEKISETEDINEIRKSLSQTPARAKKTKKIAQTEIEDTNVSEIQPEAVSEKLISPPVTAKKMTQSENEPIARSQTGESNISGQVLSAENMEPLPGAISIIDIDDSKYENLNIKAHPLPDLQSFNHYLKERIKFSESDSTIDRAVVVLKVTIQKSGKLGEIKKIKSPSEKFTDEAVRLIEEWPAWQPSFSDGKAINSDLRIRIVFKR